MLRNSWGFLGCSHGQCEGFMRERGGGAWLSRHMRQGEHKLLTMRKNL